MHSFVRSFVHTHPCRGSDFGVGDNDFLRSFEFLSRKPLLVTEFGVDVYDDECGRSNESVSAQC